MASVLLLSSTQIVSGGTLMAGDNTLAVYGGTLKVDGGTLTRQHHHLHDSVASSPA
jgi:hypothetical protein